MNSEPDHLRSDVGHSRVRSGNALEMFCDARQSPLVHMADRGHRHDLYQRLALTFERLGDLSAKRGIDIGCGSGPYMAEALKRGAQHVVGLDPAPGMLELARGRMEVLGRAKQTTFVTGYFPQTAPDGPFDFAIVVGVLDYVAQPAPFLASLRRIVTGRAVVSFPGKHWLRTPIRKFRYRLRNCPVYAYDEPTIRALGRDAGFGTVDVVRIDASPRDYLACLAP